jgi:hypothetical protein
MDAEGEVDKFVYIYAGVAGESEREGWRSYGVGAFVPGCFMARYNCHHIFRGRIATRYKCVILTFVPVGATTRYKCEAFVPGGLEEAPTRPCELREHLY